MKRWLPLALWALLLAGCEPPAVDGGDSAQLVRTVEVRQGRLQHRLSFHGVLEPVTRARLAFQSPGVLATRPAAMGQFVRQGELLATLDNPELGPSQRAAAARLQEALTQRDQAARDLARLRSLVLSGAVGEEQVEQKAAELESLQASVAQAEADLAGSRQRLADATLLAPFDGVVSMTLAEPGEFVPAGQPVLALGGLDRLEVRVLLPASLVGALKGGDALDLRVPQLDQRTMPALVTEVLTLIVDKSLVVIGVARRALHRRLAPATNAAGQHDVAADPDRQCLAHCPKQISGRRSGSGPRHVGHGRE